VIGGIYEERKTGAENRIPLLADLPIIGPLFKNRRETDGQGELLIFITPSILQPPTG
jgi:type IV pilus assembly protein PilQ